MLIESYAPAKEIVLREEQAWKEFDQSVFENPETIGKCGFVSSLENEPVGFASWDPRNLPEFALVGHDCILPKFQGQGLGRLQLIEVVKRLNKLRVKKIKVSTGADGFFLPARRMYLSGGFQEIRRAPHHTIPNFEVVYFEKVI